MREPLPQLEALTGLRGIAAWLVVLYHIRLSLAGLVPPGLIDVLAKGYLAVDLFFMLSGFVIWYSYAERLRSGGASAVRLFWWRRVARIWPLHALILAAFAVLVGLLSLSGRAVSGYPLGELPLHLLLMQNWGLTGTLTWNHPAWSISTELAAYLLFPLLVLAGRADRWTTGALLAAAAGLAAGLHLIYALNGHDRLGDAITQLGLWRCLAGFALGTVLCRLWQRWQDRPRAAQGLCGLALLLAVMGWALGAPETAIVPAVFCAGLLALALGRGWLVRLLASGPVRYLGEISYSTYLSHYLLWIVCKLLFVGPSLQLGLAGLAGYLGTVLIVSAILYRGVERPAQRWLNARPPRWIAPAARPATR